jgi:hypothetical protein
MPKVLHDRLVKEGKAKGLKGVRLDHYVYGTLNKLKKKRKKRLGDSHA